MKEKPTGSVKLSFLKSTARFLLGILRLLFIAIPLLLFDEVKGFFKSLFKIRNEPTAPGKFLMAMLCLSVVGFLWWYVTKGSAEERILSPLILPSPADIWKSLPELWFDRALSRSIVYSLARILGGFALAVLVGVPIGVLTGVLKRVEAFFTPIDLFLRYEPIAALIPLTLVWFGTGEEQKVMFIFLATVGFVMRGTALAIDAVDARFLDTAYTLGAKRRHTIGVLFRIALPDIVGGLSSLLGAAFGLIILAEFIDAQFGLGYIIQISQRRGPREHIYAVLFVITIIALLINKFLQMLQAILFPYKTGR